MRRRSDTAPLGCAALYYRSFQSNKPVYAFIGGYGLGLFILMRYVNFVVVLLYGNISALQYRRLAASDMEDRIRKVTQAVQDLLSLGQPVYLIRDNETWFNILYPALKRSFNLTSISAPLPLFQITRLQQGSSAGHIAQDVP